MSGNEIARVTLTLALPGRRDPALRLRLPLGTVELDGRSVFGDFRAISGDRGMAMTDAEIRATCWAPMLAKLVGLTGGEAELDRGSAARFAERALSFLAVLAFPRLHDGDHVTIAVDRGGEAVATRRPARLLARNRRRLGNWRQEMRSMSGAMTQVA